MKKLFSIVLLFTIAFYPFASAQAQSKKERVCRALADFFATCMLYGIKTNNPCVELGSMVNSRMNDTVIANSCISFCSGARELKVSDEYIKENTEYLYTKCLQ